MNAFYFRSMKQWALAFAGAMMVLATDAQVYIEKQTRHRFAQLNLGFDGQASAGGSTYLYNPPQQAGELILNPLFTPRFLIGGTHFWGHADFYLAIPLFHPSFTKEEQEISYSNNVETVFKYYPWRIEHHRLSPFIGFSLTPASFSQSDLRSENGQGATVTHTTFPLLTGVTFNTGNHLFELGASWHYSNSITYYFSETESRTVQTPPLSFSLSYRYMMETTISAERDWESGKTEAITENLEAKRRLNGIFAGAGISSAWWLTQSGYNKAERPFIPAYGISILPEFAAGYYFHKTDLNLTLNYRAYHTEMSAYGTSQKATRKSLGFEVTKFLFDYKGFAPFAGPVVTYEDLSFKEKAGEVSTVSVSDQKPTWGITFGWDIRPNRLQAFLLRTNLRYFPALDLEVKDDETVSFDNIEFNFIELIVFPGRMFSKKFREAISETTSR